MISYEHYYRYSPKPIDAYILGRAKYCTARAVMNIESALGRAATWNLIWLSYPSFDALPEHGMSERVFDHFKMDVTDLTIIGTLTEDARQHEIMCRKLVLHPSRFADWFRREDHSAYQSYEELGDDWVTNVMTRAALAASRMANEIPAVRDKSYLSGPG
jgi:hypothetical protein